MQRPIILLIDYEPKRIEQLKQLLHKHYEIIVAKTGQEALDLFNLICLNIKVVLLNIYLPDMSGIDLLDLMKQKSLGTKFIVFSQKSSLSQALEVMKKGGNDYIDSALLEKKLLNAVKETMEKVDILEKTEAYIGIQFINQFGGTEKLCYLNRILKKIKTDGGVITLEEIIKISQSNLYNNLAQNKYLLGKFGFKKTQTKSDHILIVDADNTLAQRINIALGKACDISIAKNGKVGKFILKKNKDIDVILLNINLPDVNSDYFLPQLKNIRQNTEIIVISAFRSIEHTVGLLKKGAFDFLNKTFTTEKLLLSVNLALQKISIKQFLPEFYKKFVRKNLYYRYKTTLLKELDQQNKMTFLRNK